MEQHSFAERSRPIKFRVKGNVAIMLLLLLVVNMAELAQDIFFHFILFIMQVSRKWRPLDGRCGPAP